MSRERLYVPYIHEYSVITFYKYLLAHTYTHTNARRPV